MTLDPTMVERLTAALEALATKPTRAPDDYITLTEAARRLPGPTADNKELIRARCPRHRRPGKDCDYYLWPEVQRFCMETIPPEPTRRAKRRHPEAPPAIPFKKPRGGRRRN